MLFSKNEWVDRSIRSERCKIQIKARGKDPHNHNMRKQLVRNQARLLETNAASGWICFQLGEKDPRELGSAYDDRYFLEHIVIT